jgi:hypothetical protein
MRRKLLDTHLEGDRIMAVPHAQPGEIVGVRPVGAGIVQAKTTTLIKTKNKLFHQQSSRERSSFVIGDSRSLEHRERFALGNGCDDSRGCSSFVRACGGRELGFGVSTSSSSVSSDFWASIPQPAVSEITPINAIQTPRCKVHDMGNPSPSVPMFSTAIPLSERYLRCTDESSGKVQIFRQAV